MNNLFFSIVIPTCDRPHLLKSTLKAALSVDYDNYEVVVSDNYSTPETYEVVKSLENCKVRYFRTSHRLNMADNWQFAYQHAKGDYIIILGDDDGITKAALKRASQIIQRTNVELLTWMNRPYWHPDWPTMEKNHINIGKQREVGLSLISPLRILKLATSLQHVAVSYFPHGSRFCFSSELGKRVCERVGRLFDNPYPDFTSGLYLLAELMGNPYAYYTGVITFTTYSYHSNSAAFLNSKNRNIQRLHSFISESSEPLYHNTPLKSHNLWNGHAECVLKAMEYYKNEGFDFDFDWSNYFYLCYQAIISGHFADPSISKVTQLEEFSDAIEKQPKEIKDKFKGEKRKIEKGLFRYLLTNYLNVRKRYFKIIISDYLGKRGYYLNGNRWGFSNLAELCEKLDNICDQIGFIDTFYVSE